MIGIFSTPAVWPRGPPEPGAERRTARVDASLWWHDELWKGPFAFLTAPARLSPRPAPGGTIAGHKVTDIAPVWSGWKPRPTSLNSKWDTIAAGRRRPLASVRACRSVCQHRGRNDPGRGDSRGFDPRRGIRAASMDDEGIRVVTIPSRDSRSFDARSTSRSRPPAASSPPTSTAPKLSSEQEAEILKRLMQQREQRQNENASDESCDLVLSLDWSSGSRPVEESPGRSTAPRQPGRRLRRPP